MHFGVQGRPRIPVDSRRYAGAFLGAYGAASLEMPPMPITDSEVRSARAGTKTARLYDSGGLYIEVTTSGAKYWRFKYRYAKR